MGVGWRGVWLGLAQKSLPEAAHKLFIEIAPNQHNARATVLIGP
jgi:hypothetical protein